MLDALRATIRRLGRLPTRHPAPVVAEGVDPAALRAGLERFRGEAPNRFARLFLSGQPIRAPRSDRPGLEEWARCGLIAPLAGPFWHACVRVVPFDGRLIAADRLSHSDADQVFTPMFEQVYFVRNADVRPGDAALEIGVGSGVLSLFAADRVRRVTGVERSPRALDFARFNFALNEAKAPIDLRLASLFEPLDGDARYDVLLTNPPFEPHPRGASGFLHSDGGEDGLDVVRAILEGAPRHLTPEGRLAIVTYSPGSASRALLEDLLRTTFPACRLTLHTLSVQPIGEYAERFSESPECAAWRKRLSERGLTHLHFLFATAEPAERPEVRVRHPREEIAASHDIADAWLP